MSVTFEVKVRSGKEKLVKSVCRSSDRRAQFSRKNSVAKFFAGDHSHNKQETTRVIERVVSHKQQQMTSEMIPYLSTEKMLQSLWRKRQQQ
jgi:surfactin synthase thioesterase subunit